jgi:hypothetical protein
VSFVADEYNSKKAYARYNWVVPVILGLVAGSVMHSVSAGLIVFLPLIAFWSLAFVKASPNNRLVTYDDKGINIQGNGSTETIAWSAVTNVTKQACQRHPQYFRSSEEDVSYIYLITYTDQTNQESSIVSITENFYTFALQKRYALEHSELPTSNDNHLTIGKKSLPNNELES